MGSLPKVEYTPLAHHLNLLQEVIETSSLENVLVTSYSRSFNGFAAKLSENEAQKLSNMKGVVSVFPSKTYELHTTRSWSFMGLDENATRNANVESNVIVGVLDTGIWPESDSFNDTGFGPPPKKWKGSCEGGQNFTCNNKIIGARFYKTAGESTRDIEGHGTHTASTAGGNKVNDASFFGIAQGTARGGVPSARIAAYKVCGSDGCTSQDILAGFDDAIADGVDIITASLGISSAEEFHRDPLSIGAFHAVEKGIFVAQSAGNSGPVKGSVSSVAPWILTVAASSTDRRIVDKLVLGNGKTLIGNSVNAFTLKGDSFPLIHAIDAAGGDCKPEDARFCTSNCLNSNLVKGKIVICEDGSGESETERAGAVGAILPSDGTDEDVSYVSSSSFLYLTNDSFSTVISYVNSKSEHTANILKSESMNDSSAPLVASFSSRGPNTIVFDLLKPDISGPGIDILAAYPPNVPPSSVSSDERQVKFNIVSGTSMSCPHAAGVAAYIKSFHPDWSTSAIKSAIMTTATPMNGSADAEFGYGSGHLNPSKAINPGLVYEAHKEDYLTFLCGLNYTQDAIRIISGDNTTCPETTKNYSPRNLNYPSMAAKLEANKAVSVTFNRTVTNVGVANSTYKASVYTSSKFKISVVPETLSFKGVNEKQSFEVSVVGDGLKSDEITSSSLVWSDGTHNVRSPIVIYA
ncbi:subtilisin-like protease SBT4.4 [Mercurialis annua]|uniref:subtilisin-like protease SBT4.4 n=1 Tax=Mercurialis annua TaxID=3986 RepID=UPI00216006B0|nr:subtilisin-like protease SBT4.4 [Mercurialis annua]